MVVLDEDLATLCSLTVVCILPTATMKNLSEDFKKKEEAGCSLIEVWVHGDVAAVSELIVGGLSYHH